MTPKTQKLFDMKIRIVVKDKNGKVIRDTIENAHSWLGQFITMLCGEFGTRNSVAVGGSGVNLLTEAGATKAYPVHTSVIYGWTQADQSTLSDSADVTQGIIVGTDSDANVLGTYKLHNKILHGSAAGLLYYNAQIVNAVTNPSGLTLQFTMTRSMTNNTANTIIIKEVGFLIKKLDATAVNNSFLAARDVLAAQCDVPAGATATFTYVISTTIA
jgi:hypothetical protein